MAFLNSTSAHIRLFRAKCTIKVQTWDQQNEFCFEFNELGLHQEFMNRDGAIGP